MGIEKSIKKLLTEPTEMRLNEVIGILQFFDYHLDRVKGSHFHFKKANHALLTIASHNQKVQKIYLKIIKKAIIEQNIAFLYE